MPDKCCVLITDRTMTTVRKKLFFFFPDEKKDYDLRQRWIRFVNTEGWKPLKKSCICLKDFEPHYYKTGAQGKRYRLVKKLKPVATIFDPEESQLSAESKHLKSPVSVPRKSRKDFINKISLNYLKNGTKSKVLMILILR